MKESFGQRLKRCRNCKGLSGADFAQRLNVNYKTYQNYENKGVKPPLEIICKMADLLGVSVDELVGHKAIPDDLGARIIHNLCRIYAQEQGLIIEELVVRNKITGKVVAVFKDGD